MRAKLYLITRADLRHGSQAAQLVHGMATFAKEHPDQFFEWERNSNTVVCLAVNNESELKKLLQTAKNIVEKIGSEYAISTFTEPDFDNALTCIVFQPTISKLQKLCVNLPLACR